MLLLAYFSYIIADCIGWSGIISMIGCGLIQAAYAFHNIGEKYVKSLHLITRMLAEVSEAVIFLFLGIQVISYKLEWHIGFILWGFILCLISRSIVILCITSIVNYVNVDETKITLSQQIILIYGGLRGAVAFALSVLIPNDLFPINGLYHKNMIVTTTLCIILFTVGFMGITTKPLVKLLKIRKQDKHTLSLFHILNNSIIDQTLTGIETLIGSKGRNAIREFCIHIDEKYIRRILQRNPERYDEKILQVYEHIALKLLYASTHPKEIDNILKNIPESLKFNQYSRNNLLNNVTHDWIMKNHLSVVPIDDDYELHNNNNNNNNITNNNNNNGNNDNDDGDTLDGESFISARQMMTTMNMNKKRHSKFSINTNDIHFDNLTQIDNRLSGYSMPKRKCQLDFNEAFSDLLQCRRETIKNHMTVNSNNNNNNLEMMNKNHFEHVNKMNCKTHQKTNELEKIQTLNIEHDTDDKQEKCGKIDSCIEQHHLVEQSTNNNASSSSFTHSLQPQIKDYRKNK
ncbi:Sodium/hydrogen exchanger 2 [Schistosoma japonicum]|nr:Sodium/hydrogen exchanger 2 [Schistosoma japonicum]